MDHGIPVEMGRGVGISKYISGIFQNTIILFKINKLFLRIGLSNVLSCKMFLWGDPCAPQTTLIT